MPEPACFPRITFPEYFDERMALEAPMRGYVSDVAVELEGGRRYSLLFMHPIRIYQEVSQAASRGEPCYDEPNLIPIMPEVTVEAIRDAVRFLHTRGFFEHLKAL